MGRKKRCAYWMNATTTPTVTARKMPGSEPPEMWWARKKSTLRMMAEPPLPDDQRDRAGREELDDGVVEGVGEDGIGPGPFVFGVDGGEVVEGALTRG